MIPSPFSIVPPIRTAYLATLGTTDSPQTLTGSINVYGMRQWAKFMSQTYPSARLSARTSFNALVTFLNAGTKHVKQTCSHEVLLCRNDQQHTSLADTFALLRN
jgi:hypothetical protein